MQLPEGMKQQGRYRVTLTPHGLDKAVGRTTDSDPQGAFCFQARPGDYSIQVQFNSSGGLVLALFLVYVEGLTCFQQGKRSRATTFNVEQLIFDLMTFTLSPTPF